MIAMTTKKDVYQEEPCQISATCELKCFEYLSAVNVVHVSEWHESISQTDRQQFLF